MVGLQKFMRQYKRNSNNEKLTDEEITELWLDYAKRGEIYYYESKLANPRLSDADISRNYREELRNIKHKVYNDCNHWNGDKMTYADYTSKDYDCGCKDGQKCPTYYRYRYYQYKYSKELDDDHPWRFDHCAYYKVEGIAKVRSKKYCNFYKNQMSDMCDTKPACEIPVSSISSK